MSKVWLLFDSNLQKQSHPMNEEQTQKAIFTLKLESKRYYIWSVGWPQWVLLDIYLQSPQSVFHFAPQRPTDDLTIPTKDIKDLSGLPDHTLTNTRVPKTDSVVTHVSQIGFTKVDMSDPKSNGKADYGYYHQDVHADDLSLSKINKIKPKDISEETYSGADRRTAIRHNFEIEVLIFSKTGKSFRTFSKNISLSGTLLAKGVPKEFLKESFELIIINQLERDPLKQKLHFKGKVVGSMDDPRRLTFVDQDKQNLAKLKQMLESYLKIKESKKD